MEGRKAGTSTSTWYSAPLYSTIMRWHWGLGGFVSRKKGARSMGEEKKEGKEGRNIFI